MIAGTIGIIGLFGSTAATTETTMTVTTDIGATAIGIGGTTTIAACCIKDTGPSRTIKFDRLRKQSD